MKVALVSLPLVGQRYDPFGSIPAMPTALPPLVGWLRRTGAQVQVIDGFAEGVSQRYRPVPGLIARGLTPGELVDRIDGDVDLVGLSVHSVASDTIALDLIAALRKSRRGVKLAVGGAHPSVLPTRFLDAGADWVVTGEGERGLERLISSAPNCGTLDIPPVPELDELPLPEFDLLPLEVYWGLGLGHGPVRGKYLNISTSRGCTQGCRFCSTPALARGRWRAMSPERVLSLLVELHRRFDVREFHIEDDDFSADRERVKMICELILSHGLDIRLSLPSGVRAQALDADTVQKMAAAGFRYLSLAPESGANRVLRSMGKEVDLDHLFEVAKEAVSCGMRVGCFLIVGYPGEGRDDRAATGALVKRLVQLGVDDLSVFIWSPLPGAAMAGVERGYDRLEQLCWTPRWRARYGLYEGARIGLYLRAISAMVRSRPASVVSALTRIATGRFETKGEMTLHRMLRWRE